MKVTHIICLVVLLFTESSAQDQIKQGVYSLGGTISYSSMKNINGDYEIDYSTYALAPSISYFFIDQCEVSFGVDYAFSSMKYNSSSSLYSSGENKSRNLALNLGIRFYLPFGKVAPFLGASGQISWTTPYIDSSQPFLPPITGYNIIGGLEIFISQSAAIEPAVTYSRIRYDSQSSNNVFLVGIGAKYFIL
jgi:hypothetical protein